MEGKDLLPQLKRANKQKCMYRSSGWREKLQLLKPGANLSITADFENYFAAYTIYIQ
jgi:hypothetical protein